MRVLIINTSERLGGAAVAASRLMESLKNNGIKAKMLVRDKQTDQISVVGLQRNWWQVWSHPDRGRVCGRGRGKYFAAPDPGGGL